MSMKRRDFLAGAAAGSAMVTMPGLLASCGVQRASSLAAPVPANPFMDWFGVDEAAVSRVMSELTANGADLADVYFEHRRASSLMLEGGAITNATSTIEQGVGLRVVVGGQTGYASSEDLAMPSMLAAARKAAAVAAGAAPAAPRAFVAQPPGDLYTTTVPWADVGVDRKAPLLQFVEDTARSLEPAVEKVSVYWADSDDRVMIATLDGRLVTDHRPMTRMTIVVTARKGDEVQSGYANMAAREDVGWYSQQRLAAAVQEAVDRTMILFDARRPPTGEMPVILASGAGGILLHEAIGHGMEADFNRNGTSSYADRIGSRVAESFVTVVDRADIPHEPGALNYDDEGNRAGRTVLVEQGVLKSFLHDQISAAQFNVATTGSGRRESYRFAPMPRMTCTFMEAGPHAKDEIIAAVKRGIICETYTNGRVDLGTGDYSFQIKNGWLVEGGKVTTPLKDITIAGNGPDLLSKITMVADDARLDSGGWTCGKNGQSVPVSQGIPTILVSKVSVAGKSAA